MNPWFAKVLILVSGVAMVIIRNPHEKRSRRIKTKRSLMGPLEIVLLKLTGLGLLVPLIWIATPVLAFADYPLWPVPFAGGILCLALGLWIFQRSHSDLCTNWSVTLETRENHQLVTEGIYRHVRHPMYLAFLLYSLGQALVLPNWVAGPSLGAPFGLLFALRVGPEERMMLDEFGKDYEAFMTRTQRLVPGVW